MTAPLDIGGVRLQSRFFLGTAGYPSPAVLQEAIAASGTQVVTVGLKRQLAGDGGAEAGGRAGDKNRFHLTDVSPRDPLTITG